MSDQVSQLSGWLGDKIQSLIDLYEKSEQFQGNFDLKRKVGISKYDAGGLPGVLQNAGRSLGERWLVSCQ
jgi:hypothetical protein